MKRIKPNELYLSVLSVLLLTLGCATQTTVIERKSTFGGVGGSGGMGDGRPGINVDVRNDGLYYDGRKYTKERVVKKLLADELKNNAPTRDRRIDNAGVLLRPVHLYEKEDLPYGYTEELRRYFIANKIPGVVIVKRKSSTVSINDQWAE